MKKIFFIALILTLSLFTGCNGDKNTLVGSWAVEELRIKGYGLVDMVSNDLNFDENGKCNLPQLANNWDVDPQGNWSLLKKMITLL